MAGTEAPPVPGAYWAGTPANSKQMVGGLQSVPFLPTFVASVTGDATMTNTMIENETEEKTGPQIVRATEILPEQLYIIPVRPRPFFPGFPMPLLIDDPPLIKTVKKALEEASGQALGLVLAKGDGNDPDPANRVHRVGTVGRILKAFYENENTVHLLINCLERFSIKEISQTDDGLLARVEYHYATESPVNPELKAYSMSIVSALKELHELSPIHSEAIKMYLSHSAMDDPGKLADFAAHLTMANGTQLQEVLEALDVMQRLDKVLVLLKQELEVSRLKQKISKQIEEKISKTQREFFLREQMKAIKQELGLEKEGKAAEVESFQKRVENLKLSAEVKKVIDEEMEKFKILEPASPEYIVTRNYLDWLTILPWGKFSKDRYSIKRGREILDRDHYGLGDVKDRILEFIAVGKLKGDIAGSILCLVGPPGVGKTSIGKSIAEAIDRKFFRFSLGGIRDEAEIKGHRRTYIGALPGKFVQAMKGAGTANPVIMLDEIDKIGISYHGDPASSLLEVLDPEQNNSFRDHYLDVPMDLSHVLFIATANQLDTIPGPLLDRMEVIRLSGYILEEKVEIARRYLLPRALQNHGINKDQVIIQKDALVQIIDGYAREAGVRNLEKQIKRILRKCAVRLAEGKTLKIVVRKSDVDSYLGKPVFTVDHVLEGRAGVVTGLAWTVMGGDTLQIEATFAPSKSRGFKQTGQLGSVMVESSEIAYSYVMAHIGEYGVEEDFFEKHFVHLHVPEGATPKDGPSAGITMATALVSMLKKEPVVPGLAMTGELTLTGQVLPIGGLKEKIIAARRARRLILILPDENKRDFDELPDYLRENLTVHFAKDYNDVYRHAFSR